MHVTKYSKLGSKYYVKIDGELVAGFINEELADIFIEGLNSGTIKQRTAGGSQKTQGFHWLEAPRVLFNSNRENAG